MLEWMQSSFVINHAFTIRSWTLCYQPVQTPAVYDISMYSISKKMESWAFSLLKNVASSEITLIDYPFTFMKFLFISWYNAFSSINYLVKRFQEVWNFFFFGWINEVWYLDTYPVILTLLLSIKKDRSYYWLSLSC